MWLLITADLCFSCPLWVLVNRFTVTTDSASLAWALAHTEIQTQIWESWWDLLFKILLLDTVQAPGSKRTVILRSQLSIKEISWHLGCWKPGWEPLMRVTGDYSVATSGCSSSRSFFFDLFYLTAFQGLALFHQKEKPAGAQHDDQAQPSIPACAEGSWAMIDTLT